MKITRIRTKLYEFETSRPLGDANLPQGCKKALQLYLFIDTDEGLTGVSLGNPVAGQIISSLEPLLIGKDPRGVRGLWKSMVDYVFKDGSIYIGNDQIPK